MYMNRDNSSILLTYINHYIYCYQKFKDDIIRTDHGCYLHFQFGGLEDSCGVLCGGCAWRGDLAGAQRCLGVLGVELEDELAEDEDDHEEHEDAHDHDGPPEHGETPRLRVISRLALICAVQRRQDGLLVQTEVYLLFRLKKNILTF